MKLPKTSVIACLLAAVTLLSTAPAGAQIQLDSSGDSWDKLSRCSNAWECFKQQQTEKEKKAEPVPIPTRYIPVVTPYIPPLVLHLPNLVPTDVDAKDGWQYGAPGSLAVKARVDNVGDADSAGFDFQGTVSVVRVDTGNTVSTTVVQEFVPSLLKGDNWDKVLGFFSLPDRDFDYDIVMTVIADSTNAASGGAIWESSETDNELPGVTCRMYGNAPGQSQVGSTPAC